MAARESFTSSDAVLARERTDVADVVLAVDGIIEVRMRTDVRIDVDEMAQVLAAHDRVAPPGLRALTLVDARPVRTMTRAAQEMTAHPSRAPGQAGVAILIANPVSRMLGNVFLRLVRPPYPTRLESNEALARAWLKSLERRG